MPSCKICDFDPEDYGYNTEQSVPLGSGGYVSLLTCDRCGCSVCSAHAETGAVSGFGDEWADATLCIDCVNAVNEESAEKWEEDYGNSGLENPYIDKEEP